MKQMKRVTEEEGQAVAKQDTAKQPTLEEWQGHVRRHLEQTVGPLRTYSWRAECQVDVWRFFAAAEKAELKHERFVVRRDGWLQATLVELAAHATLEEVRALMDRVPDSHVMLETLRACPLVENSLKRPMEEESDALEAACPNWRRRVGRALAALCAEAKEAKTVRLATEDLARRAGVPTAAAETAMAFLTGGRQEADNPEGIQVETKRARSTAKLFAVLRPRARRRAG